MKRVLVNAVSAKHGGAKTIVTKFAQAAGQYPNLYFIVIAGFDDPKSLAPNVKWHFRPRSGISAVVFTLFGALFPYLRYRCSRLLSFNNVNCLLISAAKRVTYFHQLKALDGKIDEPKLHVIRSYLRLSREKVIVQSNQVKFDFLSYFGSNRHEVMVAWPGVLVPVESSIGDRESRCVLVPVASPESPHKNFNFILEVAKLLGSEWTILVTAPAGLVDSRGVNNIRFIGSQDRVAMFDLYRRSTCVMMASTHETVGLPIFEALAVGTPVVAYGADYIRGLREEFEIGSGLSIVMSPMEAKKTVENLSATDTLVDYKKDFRLGEWNRLLSVL